MSPRTKNRHRNAAAVADPEAREFLRKADPVLAQVIDAHPDFHPRAWIDELPPFDAFGTLVFQVIGQQLSVSATRTILARLQQRFGGHMPSPAELLAADPQELRASGMSTRKAATLRALAERFVDGRLSDDAFARMTDDEIEAALTEVPGHRALDGTRLPDLRPRSARRPALRRSRAAARGRAGLRIRPPSNARTRWSSWPSAGDRIEASP